MYHVKVIHKPIYGAVGSDWKVIRHETCDVHYLILEASSANVARKCAYMYEIGDDVAHTPMKEALKNTELVYEGGMDHSEYVKGAKIKEYEIFVKARPNGLVYE